MKKIKLSFIEVNQEKYYFPFTTHPQLLQTNSTLLVINPVRILHFLRTGVNEVEPHLGQVVWVGFCFSKKIL